MLLLWRRQSVEFFRERLASVEALRQSEARYHQVLDNMMEGCQIIGFDWRYLYVNETAARFGRQEREALLGHTVMARYPGIEDTALFAVLRRCMEERTAQRIESEFAYPDASRAWFVFAIQPVPEGIFILTLDITERKQAEEALRRYAERLAAINRLDRVVTSSLDLGQVYDSFVQELTGMVPVDRTSIVALDEAGAQWQIARQWTRHQPEIQAGEWRPVAGSVIEWLATHRAPLVEREIGEAGDWPETALLRKEGGALAGASAARRSWRGHRRAVGWQPPAGGLRGGRIADPYGNRGPARACGTQCAAVRAGATPRRRAGGARPRPHRAVGSRKQGTRIVCLYRLARPARAAARHRRLLAHFDRGAWPPTA
ncbi:MAG: PAS domain-containing protein [Anaerolineae bacterium]|nr:PAS domain-containing protein [Anaerolineae bacterium]